MLLTHTAMYYCHIIFPPLTPNNSAWAPYPYDLNFLYLLFYGVLFS